MARPGELFGAQGNRSPFKGGGDDERADGGALCKGARELKTRRKAHCLDGEGKAERAQAILRLLKARDYGRAACGLAQAKQGRKTNLTELFSRSHIFTDIFAAPVFFCGSCQSCKLENTAFRKGNRRKRCFSKGVLAEKTRLSARLRIRIRPGGNTQSGGVGRRGCR